MSYQEQLPTPQELSYRRDQIDSADYSDQPNYDVDRMELQKRVDAMIDESDALAHQALSRIFELVRSEDGTSEG